MELKNYCKAKSATALNIGECRFSYAWVFTPKKTDDGNEKYSAQLIIPKSNTAFKKLYDAAIAAAIEAGISAKWDGKKPGKLTTPLRDGDMEFPGEELYEGMWFMNVSTGKDNKPGVAVLEDGAIVDALDTEDFYSGCYGVASVNFGAYNSHGNKGVGAFLNNVIKTRDGERLGGTSATAAEDFADLVG